MIVSELKSAVMAHPNQIAEIKVRFDSSLPLVAIRQKNGRYVSRELPCRLVQVENGELILIVGEN